MRYDISNRYNFRCGICGKPRDDGHHTWCPCNTDKAETNYRCPRCESKAVRYDSDGWGICLDCGKHGRIKYGFGLIGLAKDEARKIGEQPAP